MDSVNQFLTPPLFLKPLLYPGPVLYSKHITSLGHTIAFRSFILDRDVDIVHEWVNMDYALKYWQLDGPRQRVYDTYYNIQRNSACHSYMGLLDGEPVCQFDVYRVMADEIIQYIPDAGLNDCGFHLLMSPNNQPLHGLTTALIDTFLEYYFSFPEAWRMYGEPDITNNNSNRLLRDAGFQLIQAIQMSYKKANLYCLTRSRFKNNRIQHS